MNFNNPYGGFLQPNLNQYNPNYQSQNANLPAGGSFIWVNSRKEAEEYPLGANGAQMMMNRNEKVFYLKACDGFGMVLYFKEFPYCEKTDTNRPENAAVEEKGNLVEYVSREEFEALKAEFEALKPAKKSKVTEDNAK
ncbi:MAG: hypothetical protein NC253_05390 [Ruminococcus sp.]|nr:hypothetical protein [Ruminococcus sp.]MCM1381805.1 hypothetical protein [Muribaculaceae bacterium]MCM1478263.1 hypothetical protein [Muribaculaceae bacterium]